MERMEYDPEGGNYLPVTEHETGATLIVAGLIMLIAAAGYLPPVAGAILQEVIDVRLSRA